MPTIRCSGRYWIVNLFTSQVNIDCVCMYTFLQDAIIQEINFYIYFQSTSTPSSNSHNKVTSCMISEQVVIYLVVSPFMQHLQLFRSASIDLPFPQTLRGREDIYGQIIHPGI